MISKVLYCTKVEMHIIEKKKRYLKEIDTIMNLNLVFTFLLKHILGIAVQSGQGAITLRRRQKMRLIRFFRPLSIHFLGRKLFFSQDNIFEYNKKFFKIHIQIYLFFLSKLFNISFFS